MASINSPSAFAPFTSAHSPPTRAKGTVSSASVASRPTARDTTTSNAPRIAPSRLETPPESWRTPRSCAAPSARACTTRTRSSPSSRDACRQKAHFFSVASSSVNETSGSTQARASPGRPPPVPTSSTRSPASPATSASASTGMSVIASRMWRVHASSASFTAVRFTTALAPSRRPR